MSSTKNNKTKILATPNPMFFFLKDNNISFKGIPLHNHRFTDRVITLTITS